MRSAELRVRKGAKTFSVPPAERLTAVFFRVQGKKVSIFVEDIEFIQKKRKDYQDMVGLPLYCALARGANEVHLYPSPYVSINLTIEYDPLEKSSAK